jgi:RNA-directed DNA polymerase
MGGTGGMIKTPITLQDLRRKIYTKAKADTAWRFWGLYVHVCKMETLNEAYFLAKKNNGAPGIDGVTFEAIEASSVEAFLKQIQDELTTQTYRPLRNRRHLPMLSVAAHGTGGGAHQPDPAWLGPVLCGWRCQSVLRLRQGLGGEEGAAPLDACPGASGLRLRQVE